ncbi:hypothetical protein [Corynebacterium caspium]|uniref:hypothetical protein n=1 Tax=Corynebacterium caspium TaxID=234828 RepID=UPI00037E7106|nr:hypothetical protein [Corynebacterium caspium]WKD59509.1 hypothetical protein CCASP_05610 [Corynebacterium caspium DSM 44850]
MAWFILIAALAIFTILGNLLWGKIFGRGELMPPLESETARQEVLANNSAAIASGDFAALKFEVVARGYRQEQVDAVLQELIEHSQELQIKLENMQLVAPQRNKKTTIVKEPKNV